MKSADYLANNTKDREAEMPIEVQLANGNQGMRKGTGEDFLTALQRELDRKWVSHAGAWHVVRDASR